MAKDYQQPNNRGGYQGGQPNRPNTPPATQQSVLQTYEKKIPDWIRNGFDKETIAFAEKFGKHIASPNDKSNDSDALTTSQIRIFFGELRRIQMGDYDKQTTDFLMLRPKLAYAVKRHNKEGLKSFYDFFCKAHECVSKKGEFENFIRLIEAVLAFHKFHGGKE